MVDNYQIEGTKMVFEMPMELDDHQATRLREKMDMLIDAYQIRQLILDFSKTEFMDSSGIGMIIGRSRSLHFLNGNVYVVNISEQVNKIFEASGLYRIVGTWEGSSNE